MSSFKKNISAYSDYPRNEIQIKYLCEYNFIYENNLGSVSDAHVSSFAEKTGGVKNLVHVYL